MSTISKFFKKEEVNQKAMVEGFYKGVGATVGLMVVASAPEVVAACVIGVIIYDKAKNFVEAKIEQRAEEIAAQRTAQ